MKIQFIKYFLLPSILIFSSLTFADADKRVLWTIDDLLQSNIQPYVIGHRGYGENLGEIPLMPVENTVDSVKRAFKEGVSIVEVDVVVTSDGKAVAIHDDFLSDFTCINTLTYDELKERLPHVPSLKKVLQVAKKFAGKSDQVSGLVNIEVKTPAPLCDATDTTEAKLVASVIDAVEKTRMQEQVIIEGFSPSIVAMFATEASHLKRSLTVSALQLISSAQVEAITGLTVTPIDKQVGFGLEWGETGVIFRLPGYRSFDEYVGVAFQLGAEILTIDKLILFQLEQIQPGSGSIAIQQLHQLGFTITVYTVDSDTEWQLLESMGVDGIITNDIPMGLSLQN